MNLFDTIIYAEIDTKGVRKIIGKCKAKDFKK